VSVNIDTPEISKPAGQARHYLEKARASQSGLERRALLGHYRKHRSKLTSACWDALRKANIWHIPSWRFVQDQFGLPRPEDLANELGNESR
jgi:hypothetical protein